MRPHAAADIHPDDAAASGIRQDDDIVLSTQIGSIHVKANVTYLAKKGVVFMYQGYEKADGQV